MTKTIKKDTYRNKLSYLYMTIIALCVVYCVGLSSPVNASPTTRVVTSEAEFYQALNNSSADIIEISGNVLLTSATGSDGPLIITRPVTIQGGVLDLRCLGIVLGADVTFQNIELNLTSSESNIIAANGYTLTMNNVSKSNSVVWSTHLTCGSLTGYGYSNLPAAGNHGQVVIKGNCKLGNIYTGNIGHPSSLATKFDKNATITIDSSASGTIGNIYCHGGAESMGSGTGDVITDSTNYISSGVVNVNIYGNVVKKINGATGHNSNAHVYYNGNDYLSSVTFENIASLYVYSGKLAPTSVSTLSSNIDLFVFANTTLYLDNLASQLTIRHFTGGGSLILGRNQSLTTRTATGSTSVYIGGIQYDDTSTSLPMEDHTYITATTAAATAFTFMNHSSNPEYIPRFTANGDGGTWAICEDYEDVIKVTSATLTDTTIDVSADISVYGLYMYFDVNYTDDTTLLSLDSVILDLSINGETLDTTVVDGYPSYILRSENIKIDIFDRAIYIHDVDNNGIPPAGIYDISITIPAKNTSRNTPLTVSGTLTVTDLNNKQTTTEKQTTKDNTTTENNTTTKNNTSESDTTTKKNDSYEKDTTTKKIDSYEKDTTTKKIDSYEKDTTTKKIDSYEKDTTTKKIDSYEKDTTTKKIDSYEEDTTTKKIDPSESSTTKNDFPENSTPSDDETTNKSDSSLEDTTTFNSIEPSESQTTSGLVDSSDKNTTITYEDSTSKNADNDHNANGSDMSFWIIISLVGIASISSIVIVVINKKKNS